MNKAEHFQFILKGIGLSINNLNLCSLIQEIALDTANGTQKPPEYYSEIYEKNENLLIAKNSSKIMEKLSELGVQNPSSAAEEIAKLFMAKA